MKSLILILSFIPGLLNGQAAALLSRTTQTAGGYDTDFQAVLDRAITEGFTLPSTAQQDLMNSLVVDLKNAGFWDDIDWFAIYEHDGSEGFNRINWADPTGTLATIIGTPTWEANSGYTYMNPTNLINLNWQPADGVNFVQNTGCIGFYTKSTAGVTTSQAVFGAWNNNWDLGTSMRFTSNYQIEVNINRISGQNTFIYTGGTEQLFAFYRENSAVLFGYVNGSSISLLSQNSTAPIAQDIGVGSLNFFNNSYAFNMYEYPLGAVFITSWGRSDAASVSSIFHDYFDNN